MKILYLAAAPHVAGGNRFLLNLFDATKDEGIESIVVVPASGNMETEARNQGTQTEIYATEQPNFNKPFKAIKNLFAWLKILRKHRPDVIHANDFWVARGVCQAASLLSIPLVCHVHFKQNAEFCEWVFKGLKEPKAFVFCSHATQLDTGPALEKYYPNAAQYAVHNSVDIDKFSPKEVDIKSETSISQIGMIANIIPRKRIDDFVEVAAIVNQQYPHIQFNVIGAELEESGNYGDTIRQLIKQHKLEKAVSLLGFQSNVDVFLKKWDLVLCSAEHEELPISLIEAAASGLPIVSTNVGGISEIVEQGKSGYLVDVFDTKAMAEKVMLLIQDMPLYANMSLEARRSAKEKFHPRITADKLKTIYQSLLS
ncbi:MAG: glycosyltransferase involved in cell wall biosynthesis [Paraglaciecola sp.]|jgi:glycosyltransferase involved in cell wall biosynthesis